MSPKIIASYIVKHLSKEYGFNYRRALEFLGINVIKIVFPFSGKIQDTCKAVKWSYGLHTQCKNKPIKGCRYCLKCTEKTVIGDIEDRTKVSLLDYIDRKGRKTINWCTYIKNGKLNKDYCISLAKERNIYISKQHLIEEKKRRGRPCLVKKGNIISDVIEKDLFNVIEEKEVVLSLLVGTKEKCGVDDAGNIYKIYDFGAVQMIRP